MKKIFYVIFSVIDGETNLEELYSADVARFICFDKYCKHLQAIYQDIYPNKKVSFAWVVVSYSNFKNVFDSCKLL